MTTKYDIKNVKIAFKKIILKIVLNLEFITVSLIVSQLYLMF